MRLFRSCLWFSYSVTVYHTRYGLSTWCKAAKHFKQGCRARQNLDPLDSLCLRLDRFACLYLGILGSTSLAGSTWTTFWIPCSLVLVGLLAFDSQRIGFSFCCCILFSFFCSSRSLFLQLLLDLAYALLLGT